MDTHSFVKPGDLIQLATPSNKSHLFRVVPGYQFQTHRGVIMHTDLIGLPFGSTVTSHTGSKYVLLKPTLGDLLLETPRNTQIMYPKDIGYILLKMGIGENQWVIEAGTGSGALTIALAWIVGPNGKVISYECREEMQTLAKKNVSRLGLEERVIFKLKDISEGFEETNIDALFLDLPNPYDYLVQVSNTLASGAPFGCILPTTNQVSILLSGLHKNNLGFVEVCEILLRYYRPTYNRLRPTDRMVAHTGYLIFARSIIPENIQESSLEKIDHAEVNHYD